MPNFWQDSLDKTTQEFVVGNQSDDVFAYIWSRREKAFRDTVTIRSKSMGGWNTIRSYDILMRLAQTRFSTPQIGKMRTLTINPKQWAGIRNQYSDGVRNNHLLVPLQPETGSVTLGISDAMNTLVHSVKIQQVFCQQAVFDILMELRGAIEQDNEEYGHWHDVLKSGE